MSDNTNRPINVKVWPQIRLKQQTYDMLHMLAAREERPMVDIVDQAIKKWSRSNANGGTGVAELVELELFLRELRILLGERHATWESIASFLTSRYQIVAVSHAFVRGMLHGV